MKKKFLTTIAVVFVLAIVCTAFIPTSVAVATQYGSIDSNELWYYGQSHLNVEPMKQSIAKWIGGADKENPVIIGVIDTGVNVDHEVFERTNTLFKVDGKTQGYNSHVAATVSKPTIEQLSNVEDKSSNNHGTAVASIMAMLIYDLGLQDYIKLYPIQASTGSANGSFDTASVVKAIDFAIDTQDKLGIDVVNIAIAGYTETGANNYLNSQSKFLTLSNDCVIVAAAGNKGKSSTVDPSYPAVLDGVLSVMAYDSNGEKRANSNFGDYDVVAPGGEIYVATGSSDSYRYESGTSMATAFVSVVSAIVALREQTAQSNANATMIARHIITSSMESVINFEDYSLAKFDGYKAVDNAITETYLEPTGIAIANNHNLENNCVIYRNQFKDLTLSAELLPYGNTNPALANSVRWTQTEILSKPVVDDDGKETGESEEYDGETTDLGTGKSITYNPNLKGKYRITATYQNGDKTFSATMTIAVNYVDYTSVAGIIEVKPNSPVEGGTIDDGFVYEWDKAEFYLAGGEGLDPSVEIKWFVNGEHVHTGETFTYKATKMGKYEITAQYGDYRQIEKPYTLEVKSGFCRPAVWISFTAVVVVLAVVGGVLGAKYTKKKQTIEE